ncbi:MAG: nucleotidyltransferase domain-containing protein [Candidatus Eisenbacteria bacterium]
MRRVRPRIPRERVLQLIRSYLEGTVVIRAILFGSYATGRADAASDVDLLLVYTPEEFEYLKHVGSPFIERVCREGVEIYARSEG